MSNLAKIESTDRAAIIRRFNDVNIPESTATKELSFAMQAISGSEQLQQCDKNSLLAAIVNIANIGLTLNPAAKEAYLVPRWNNRLKVLEATLQPSYIGLVKLIMQTGGVRSMVANVVYEGDRFIINLADNRNPVQHMPALQRSKRGEKIGTYALATLNDGTRQVEWMEIADVYIVRESSDSYKNEKTRQYSPWVKHEDEMIRKTVVRRLYKYLPRVNNEQAVAAIALDEQDYQATFNQKQAIEDMLRGANLSPERLDQIGADYMNYSYREAQEVLSELREAQTELDPAKQFKSHSK